ncbi:hypothetical protein BS47DRAFT_1340096 [Hydnum rufescens UP504]|uniref:Uncharacterized protein n=1 Tax=Hydnum rufescens UP504 TaxID=1448309 RepID=A0A9P6B3U1_9AGAM|nr:hypothetical protein BS47DRAFT_1340096 [Hydnum rufescens UP504]
MVSLRFASFLAVASFGLFACAKPIKTADIAARDIDVSLMVRGDFPDHACGCQRDLLDVLITLKADIDVILPNLDGKMDPKKSCDDIIVAVNVAIGLIAEIEIDAVIIVAELADIVSVIISILLGIVGACGRYSVDVCAQLILELDVCLAALIKVVIELIPVISVELTAALHIHLEVFAAVKLVLTLLAGGAPCGCE